MFAAYKHRCSVLVKADPHCFEQSCDQLENNSIPTFRYRARHSHCELAAVKWANKNKQSPKTPFPACFPSNIFSTPLGAV